MSCIDYVTVDSDKWESDTKKELQDFVKNFFLLEQYVQQVETYLFAGDITDDTRRITKKKG